jgi:hypothetical protein
MYVGYVILLYFPKSILLINLILLKLHIFYKNMFFVRGYLHQTTILHSLYFKCTFCGVREPENNPERFREGRASCLAGR